MGTRHIRVRLIAAAAVTTLAASVLAVTPAPAEAADSAPTNVIVQFAGQPALSVSTGLAPAARASAQRSRRQALRTAHQTFLRAVATAGVPATTRGDFGDLYNGIALRLPQRDVPRLATMPGVAAVIPDRVMHASVEPDVSLIKAPQVWATTDPNGTPDSGTGEVVAVVDTGIDYTDADLGDGFGPGHKVAAGYDLVNNDADPMDDQGHGTHVAGIIAGKAASPDGQTGVAPDATLTAYKVLDSTGEGYESTIIAGLERATDPANPYRADVVNLSLEGDGGADDPVDAACEAAEQAGVVVVAAAGNHGPYPDSIGSPAEAPDVLAVGASVSGVTVPSISLVSPVSQPLHSVRVDTSANPPAKPVTMQVVDVRDGAPDDYDGLDVTGKAVLLRYAQDGFDDTAAVAKQHGAAMVIGYTPNYYGQSGGTPGGGLPSVAGVDDSTLGLVAVVINGSDAGKIQNLLANGTVTIGLTGSDATDQMADFSARGPVPGSYAAKPDLVAPGVDIRSTIPGGAYERMSGTSMAAPHVAGAAALVRQAHPDWSAAEVQAALTSSAQPLSTVDPDTVGSGRLDALAAVQATVLPSPRSVDMGLADLGGATISAEHTITLTNTGNASATVALTATSPSTDAGRASLSVSRVQIRAGGTASVVLRLSADRPDTVVDLDGTVAGTVTSAGHTSRLSVPYLLAVRPMDLHATPDPTATTSTILIHSEPNLTAAPGVTVRSPAGRISSPVAQLDHDNWWRVPVPGGTPGIYRVDTSAVAVGGARITGHTTYQVLSTTPQNNHWTSVGPYADGGYTVPAPSRPGRIYTLPTSQRHAGLFRTDDDGTTWHEERSLPIGDGYSSGLAVDPHDADTVYLVVDSNADDRSYAGHVLVSHDAGGTWTATDAPNELLRGIITDPTGTFLILNALNTIQVSADQGQTWQTIALPAGVEADSTTVVGSDLYVGTTGAGLYVVRNYASPTASAQRVYLADSGSKAIEGVVEHAGEIVAITPQRGIVSTDGGVTWTELANLPTGHVLKSEQFIGDDLYVTDTIHIWVRHAGQTSWSSVPVPAANMATTQIQPWPGHPGALLAVANGIGLYQTSDQGQHYTRIGITGSVIETMDVTRSAGGAPLLTVGTDHGTFTTPVPTATGVTSATRDWGRNGEETSLSDQVEAMGAAPTDPSTVYRAYYSGHFTWGMARSTDGGTTWTTVMTARIDGGAYQIVVSPLDPHRVYVSYHDGLGVGILSSQDSGAHWSQVQEPYPFTAMAADPTNADALWLGGPDGLFRTTDAGQTLTKLSSTAVRAIAVDPRDPRHIVAGADSLINSRDGGRTWSTAAGDDLRMRVTSVVFGPNGVIYAGTGQSTDLSGLPVNGRGVLASRDGGRHWDNVSAGLANLDVRALATSPDGHWLYAGTGGGGVYRVPVG